jgi:hypothetical protein
MTNPITYNGNTYHLTSSPASELNYILKNEKTMSATAYNSWEDYFAMVIKNYSANPNQKMFSSNVIDFVIPYTKEFYPELHL